MGPGMGTLVRSMAWLCDSMAAWLSLSWATISIRFRLLAALSASISIFLLLLLLCRGTVRLKASSCGPKLPREISSCTLGLE